MAVGQSDDCCGSDKKQILREAQDDNVFAIALVTRRAKNEAEKNDRDEEDKDRQA
jgi:hypothetical protein